MFTSKKYFKSRARSEYLQSRSVGALLERVREELAKELVENGYGESLCASSLWKDRRLKSRKARIIRSSLISREVSCKCVSLLSKLLFVTRTSTFQHHPLHPLAPCLYIRSRSLRSRRKHNNYNVLQNVFGLTQSRPCL
jgi:hypothetical protein